MNRLFWKIFAWFLVAMILVAASLVAVTLVLLCHKHGRNKLDSKEAV
jgi:hypothetical protein